MRRQQSQGSSASNNSKQRTNQSNQTPSPTKKTSNSAKKIKNKLTLATGPLSESDFGEEIEDQYYKRSIPSNGVGLMSPPKRVSDLRQSASREHLQLHQISSRDDYNDDDAAALFGTSAHRIEDDHLDLDQAQFAHLSVEDESNQDENDLMANFDIEVEDDEGGPCEINNDHSRDDQDANSDEMLNQFNQEDFRRFQQEGAVDIDDIDGNLCDNSNSPRNENDVDNHDVDIAMMGLMEQDQQILNMDSNNTDDLDDYGMKVNSPSHQRLKSEQAVSPDHPAETTPNNQALRSTTDLRTMAMRDPSMVQLMHEDNNDFQEPQFSHAQPLEMLETDKSQSLSPQQQEDGQDADDEDDDQESCQDEQSKSSCSPDDENDVFQATVPTLSQVVSQQASATKQQQPRHHHNHAGQQPPMQIKSFVRLEGKIPSSLSAKNELGSSAKKNRVAPITEEYGNASTSLLQQTPLETEGQQPQLNSQALPNEDDKAVKVSQFTEQSKSVNQTTESKLDNNSQKESIPKFEFEHQLLHQQSSSGHKHMISSLGSTNGKIDLNQVQKLTSQTLQGALAATQSDFNQTKGAELALKDLLHSESPQHLNSSQRLQQSRNHESNQRQYPHTQIYLPQQTSSRAGVTDRSHRTTSALSNNQAPQKNLVVLRAKSGKKDCGPDGHDTPESMNHYSKEEVEVKTSSEEEGKKVPKLKLEQKLPTEFNKTINSARSSIKPYEAGRSVHFQKEASRAYLEDQELGLQNFAKESEQQPLDGDAAFEFKTDLKFEFKGFNGGEESEGQKSDEYQSQNNADRQSNNGRSCDQSGQDQDERLDTTQRIHTQLAMNPSHIRAPQNAHEYEAVATESALGNPVAANSGTLVKSKTSMGLTDNHRKAKQHNTTGRRLCTSPQKLQANETDESHNNSRVDQKRKIDSKLSIVRRNAEKLKQKRKDDSYKQSSSMTRTKTHHQSSVTGMNTSTVSTRSKPNNFSRLQTSQKIVGKGVDKANAPGQQQALAKKNGTKSQKINHQKKISNLSQPANKDEQNVQGASKKVYKVSRPNIPKQALLNAHNSMKQMSSSKKNNGSQNLPAAMQKMLSAVKKPNASLQRSKDPLQRIGLHEKGNSLSQATFEYKHTKDHRCQADSKSVKYQHAKALHNNSIRGGEKHQYLQASAKTRLPYQSGDPYEGNSVRDNRRVQQLKFDDNSQCQSQASLGQNTNSQSLKKLQEKYRRGSPRVYEETQMMHQMQLNNSMGNFEQKKPSLASAFDRKTSQALRPPRSKVPVKMTAAEVREQVKIERQEQVLKVQLDKIESKLDQKRREISQEGGGSRKNYQPCSNSDHQSKYGSIVQGPQVTNNNASFASHQVDKSVNMSAQMTSNEARHTNSVAESISKYKRKRMESLQKRDNDESLEQDKSCEYNANRSRPEMIQISQLVQNNQRQSALIEEVKNEPTSAAQFLQPYDNRLANEEIKVAQSQDKALMRPDSSLRGSSSSKPVFESPRATTVNQQPSESHATSTANQACRRINVTSEETKNNQDIIGETINTAQSLAAENGTDFGANEHSNRAKNEGSPSVQDRMITRESRLGSSQKKVIGESPDRIVQVLETFVERRSSVKASNVLTSCHADQKDSRTGFESIHEVVAQISPSVGAAHKSRVSYQALRQKNYHTMKNGQNFQSLRSYMEQSEKYRGYAEPLKTSLNDDVGDHSSDQEGKYNKTSPDFSQILKADNTETFDFHQMEATFKPSGEKNQRDDEQNDSDERVIQTRSSKKDQKRETYAKKSPKQKKSKYSADKEKRTNNVPKVTLSPRTSLTPVLKDSAQASKLRKEQIKKPEIPGKNRNRSYVSQDKQDCSLTKTQTSMFRPQLSNIEKDETQIHQTDAGTFFMSNLFKKLSNNNHYNQTTLAKEEKSQQIIDTSDIPSRFSRPGSQTYLGGCASRNTRLPTDQTLNVSESLSQVAAQPQGYSQLINSNTNMGPQIQPTIVRAQQHSNKPPIRDRKSLNNSRIRQSKEPEQEMKGVDFIEETKDYQRVISDLKDLLDNPRQHKPLKASSTSNISYHTHRGVAENKNNRMISVHVSPAGKSNSRQEHSPPTKMSPGMLKSIQNQLKVNQKRTFNPQAIVSVGPKQHQNMTSLNDGRACSTMEVGSRTIEPSHFGNSTQYGKRINLLGQATRDNKRQNLNYTTLDPSEAQNYHSQLRPHQSHRYPSQTSISVHSGVQSHYNLSKPQSTVNSRLNTSLNLRGSGAQPQQAGRIVKQGSSQKSLSTTLNHHNNYNQGTSLSKAEMRRKEHFDKSLQREVQAIERVIVHKEDMPKHIGPLESQAMINNYVDSLKQTGNTQNVVLSHNQSPNYLPQPPQKSGTTTLNGRSDELLMTLASQSCTNQHQQPMTSQDTSFTQVNMQSSDTDYKTQMLMQQIQELQPMVLQCQTNNMETQKQIDDLLSLHQNVQCLQDSQRRQDSSYMSVHQMLEANQVQILDGMSLAEQPDWQQANRQLFEKHQ